MNHFLPAAALALVVFADGCSSSSSASRNASSPGGGPDSASSGAGNGSSAGGSAGSENSGNSSSVGGSAGSRDSGSGSSGGSTSGGSAGSGDSGSAGSIGGGAGSGNGGRADPGVEGGVTDASPEIVDGSGSAPDLGPIVGTPLATFDSDLNGFTLNTFAEATNLAIAPTPATATWISTDGSPDPGCVKITAPYSGPNQWVDLEARSLPAPLPNWSGRTLHVRIKLEPGGAFSGTARLYVKTGAGYVFYPNLSPYPQSSGWQEFVLPLVSPAPVPPANPGADPVQVITYGIDPEVSPNPPVTPTPVTFYVDSFSIE